MNTAVMTARSEAAGPSSDRYQAKFWRSPFAVTAASVATAQALLTAFAGLDGGAFPYEAAFSLTVLTVSLMIAGVWPSWNFLSVTKDGVEQQAGLTSLRADWSQVQHVRVMDSWAELRVITDDAPGRKRVRTTRVFNRYDLSSEEFGELIESNWVRAKGYSL